jgi:hypothetical protein
LTGLSLAQRDECLIAFDGQSNDRRAPLGHEVPATSVRPAASGRRGYDCDRADQSECHKDRGSQDHEAEPPFAGLCGVRKGYRRVTAIASVPGQLRQTSRLVDVAVSRFDLKGEPSLVGLGRAAGARDPRHDLAEQRRRQLDATGSGVEKHHDLV